MAVEGSAATEEMAAVAGKTKALDLRNLPDRSSSSLKESEERDGKRHEK